jgi:glycosyltransferase involved in cell wall biosynthesis
MDLLTEEARPAARAILLVSDYVFYRVGDGFWADIPWDEEFFSLFGGAVERIYLVGRVRRAGAVSAFGDRLHRVDDRYYRVVPMPDWHSPLGWLARVPVILRAWSQAYRCADLLFLKLFYFNSVLMFLYNRLRAHKPVATLLVGDAAEAAKVRSDLVGPPLLRMWAAGLVARLIRAIQRRVDLPGVVCHALKRKYCPDRPDTVVANESWLKDWMFAPQVPEAMHEPPVVLFVGRLVEGKRVRELVRAVLELLDEGVSLRCCIVGDGPLKEELMRTVRESPCFDFRGWLRPLSPELFQTYRDADILVLPSVAEGLPLVLLEAMASGVAVIATSVAGVPQIVTDGVTGLLLADGHTESIKRAIRRYLQDPDLWRRCVVAGYQVALENTFQRQRGRFCAAMVDLLNGHRPGAGVLVPGEGR